MVKQGLLTVILVMGLVLSAQAGESRMKLLLGTVDNFPPYAYRVHGILTGVDIDVVHEMAGRLGIEVDIKAFPWARVMAFVRDGTIDGGFAAFEMEERKAFCLYTGVLHYEEFYLFVKSGTQFPYRDIRDLYGKRVGTDRGVYVTKEFEKAVNDGKILLEEVNDMDMGNVVKLSRGRLDAAIGDLGVMKYYAVRSGVKRAIVPLSPVRERTAAYLVLSKASALKDKIELQHRIRTVLDEIRKDGTWQKIFDRHMGGFGRR